MERTLKATASSSRSRKRKNTNSYYDPKTRAKIGRSAAENGNKRAVQGAAATSTVRGFKKAFFSELSKVKEPYMVQELAHGARGKPTKLGDLDKKVQAYIGKLRAAGTPVNRSIVIAAAKGMVMYHCPSLLPEHGGNLELGRKWAESLMSRMGLVRHKATKAARKTPDDFDNIKIQFLHRITKVVQDHSVPSALILNLDQTATKLVPTTEWTMEIEGSTQVNVVGLEDKREITVVLCCTLSGDLLPPQVIYTGQTSQCHPNVSFPEGWHIWHSKNHWSNEQTMLEYVKNILVPYLTTTRAQQGLSQDQKALLICDAFAAHRCESFLEENHIKVVYIPAGCTGEFDISVNQIYKVELKRQFTHLYATEIEKGLRGENEVESIKVDFPIKPIHAKWLMDVHAITREKSDLIIDGFKKSGIFNCLV